MTHLQNFRRSGGGGIKVLKALSLGLVLALLGASAAAAATLKVEIGNLRNAKGDVYLALWDHSESFTESDRTIAVAKVPAGRKHPLEFTGLAPGRYALVAYHDENENGELDRTWIGLGPPSFEEAAVELSGSEQTIVIALRY